MDALYLKENVQEAVTEALTSMMISCPDDQIEYMGTYLLNYVERMNINQKVCNTSNIFISGKNYKNFFL